MQCRAENPFRRTFRAKGICVMCDDDVCGGADVRIWFKFKVKSATKNTEPLKKEVICNTSASRHAYLCIFRYTQLAKGRAFSSGVYSYIGKVHTSEKFKYIFRGFVDLLCISVFSAFCIGLIARSMAAECKHKYQRLSSRGLDCKKLYMLPDRKVRDREQGRPMTEIARAEKCEPFGLRASPEVDKFRTFFFI